MEKKYITTDGNTAAANVAYAFSEVAAIYPITPSSGMGESADAWSAKNKKNMFGDVLKVVEMQSEAGAAGAIHGSLSVGALTTTFTASQGLLLMIPVMYKVAGELLPTVFHVASRSLACQALSIFGDHSDTMAVRNTGFALLCSSSVQEAQDMAAIAHLSTIEARIPFLHFFDGFRTSHEIQKIEDIDYATLKSMLNVKALEDFRKTALNPEHPISKVGAQNPDVYFQGRETVNKFYDEIPGIVTKYMNTFAEKTGRVYKIFEYIGHPEAEKVIIAMGSGVETIDETVQYLISKGEKVGVVKVRLYRPFSTKDFAACIPNTVKKIAVLDRTKEIGATGEPLYLDVVATIKNELKNDDVSIIGGRYGLSSKEFTPSMVKAVYDHLDGANFHDFTVGINDDVSFKSIPIKEHITTESHGVIKCKFWGYGSDGTVSANKNAIKIIGENTPMFAQAYFSYDSKKSGGTTISHLRFGHHKIKSTYLLESCDFIALHNPAYIGKFDILEGIEEEGTFFINCSWPAEEVFNNLTADMQKTIMEKKVKLYAIDASKIAASVGLGNKINTVMQAAFFKISGVLPENEAIPLIKSQVEKQFKHKGEEIVKMNWACIDASIDALKIIPIPSQNSMQKSAPIINFLPENADAFTKNIIEPIMRLKGDHIPVSAMPLNGAVPTGTSRLEKRGIAEKVPCWQSQNCIQCGQCSFVCPHAAIRIKQIAPESLAVTNVPSTFKTIKSNVASVASKNYQFKVQVYPEYCTGCGVCAQVCPSKVKTLVMVPIAEARANGENENQDFFDTLPTITEGVPIDSVKGTQLRKPYFEFSGACQGCGETPYVKLLSQLFGENMIIANATGCTSIYSGTFPTIPYCKDEKGRGPAWANSLFEDNAEFGYGMRVAVDATRDQLKANMEKLLVTGTTVELAAALQKMLSLWDKTNQEARDAESEVMKNLPDAMSKVYGESVSVLQKINELKYYLLDKSTWILGGDGWAYDIGFGGLDHVLAQNKKIRVLVLDTEVYSNTGGQASKSTPRGATAKFATAGKVMGKKNLGLMLMSYGHIYVASVNMGGNKAQVIKALIEAENFPGPAIVIAYSPCIAHGFNMEQSEEHGKMAAQAGYWPLYRFNPSLAAQGKPTFNWDSQEATVAFKDFLLGETRYKALKLEFPNLADNLFSLAEYDAKNRNTAFKKISDDQKAALAPKTESVPTTATATNVDATPK
jgi:pyruvate-ferredoxin/flavodoxin oxidoreductase